MFTAIRLLFMVLVALLPSVGLYGQTIGSDQDYKIYAQSILDLDYSKDSKQISIVDRTIFFGNTADYNDMFGHLKRTSKVLDMDLTLAHAFDRLPASGFVLEAKFSPQLNYSLISEREAAKTFENINTWDWFYKSHPDSDGIVQLSSIAYNPSKNMSLHYISYARSFDWVDAFFVIYSSEKGQCELMEKIKVFHLRPK